MNASQTLIPIWFLMACAIGCSKRSASPANTKPNDVGATYIAPFIASTTTIDGVEYQYVATAERENQIVSGFPKLKVGQSREEVRDALGLPDTAEPQYSKEANQRFLGWSYMYKIKMRSRGPNSDDVCVQVFFDPVGNLHWAVPDHIAGLKEIGNMALP